MANRKPETSPARLQSFAEKTWTYLVEIIAGALAAAALWMWLGGKTISLWQIEKRGDLVVFSGAAAGFSAAIFAAYFAVLSTDFGRKLRAHRVAAEYASAFAFPFVLFLVTIATLEFLSKNSGPFLSWVTTFLLCYAGLNCLTMVKNVVDLVRLWQDVEH